MPAEPMRLADDRARAITRRVGFTVDVLTRATCQPGRDRAWLYDSKSPLAFMVTKGGSRSFYVYRKVAGRPQRVRLGTFPELSIEQARKLSQGTVGDIARGVNPMAAKRAARAKGMNIGELFAWYLEHHAKPRKRSWKDDQNRYDNHLKAWAARRVTDIARADVAALHARIAKNASGATANRVLALLGVMYSKAALIGYDGQNPVRGVPKFSETSRDRFITPEEMPRFLEALKNEPSQDWKDFFTVCLFTGARSGNVKSMRWDELDLPGATWRVPDEKAKAGEAMLIHLPADVVALLNERKRAADADLAKRKAEGKAALGAAPSPYVFASYGKSGHVNDPKGSWAALLTRAKIEKLRIHDLRRTVGSWAAAGGASLHQIGKALGHRNVSTTQIYSRLQLDAVRSTIDDATAAMKAAKPAAK